MEFLIKYFVVFVDSLLVVLLLVPLLKRLAPSLGLLDEPDERRIHKTPTPRCGGIAVFLATHSALVVVFFGPWQNLSGAIQRGEWRFVFMGSLLLLAVGLFDDRFNMRAWFKLLGQLAVAGLMFFGGFTIETFLHIPLPFAINLGGTLFWFVLLMNAFNLIDGMDGACAGLGLIASAGLAGMLLSMQRTTDGLVLIALAGACLGFLRYNFNPASIFLGDSGSMFIGFMLAAVSLKANVKQSMVVALIVPLLAVGVPVFDVMMAVWRRLARKLISMIHNDEMATKVFGPDLDHIHHKLMRSGMTQRKAAIVLYGAAIFACVVALGAAAMTSNQTTLLMIGMIVALHIVVRKIAQVELWTTTQVMLQGVHRPRSLIALLVAVGWDLCWLVLATYLVFGVVLGKSFSVLHLVVCVMIPFSTIFFYHIYRTVWTRSRVSQLLVLVLQLAAGEALAYVALLWASELTQPELMIALILHTLVAATGIVGVRASFRVVRDISAWLHGSIGSPSDLNTLILGAGENAILYLRQASFEDQQTAPRRVIGLVDDNPSLRHKVVYGYSVLGNFSELEEIIKMHHVNELIFTHHYSEALRVDVLSLGEKHKLLVRDFVFGLHALDEHGGCLGLVKPSSVDKVECHNRCLL